MKKSNGTEKPLVSYQKKYIFPCDYKGCTKAATFSGRLKNGRDGQSCCEHKDIVKQIAKEENNMKNAELLRELQNKTDLEQIEEIHSKNCDLLITGMKNSCLKSRDHINYHCVEGEEKECFEQEYHHHQVNCLKCKEYGADFLSRKTIDMTEEELTKFIEDNGGYILNKN